MKISVITRLGLALLWLALIATPVVKAQECDSYYPMKEGTSYELSYFNPKNDKLESRTSTKISDVTWTNNLYNATATATTFDAKGRESATFAYQMQCENGEFRMDMRSYLNPAQMGGMENMDVTVDGTDLVFHANVDVGQTLPDASVSMKGAMNGMTIMNLNVQITNRKVTARETYTTPAGTFECVIIEEDATSNVMGMSIVTHSKSWYSKGAGMVRNESWRNGKMEGYALLTKLTL
jgi:hypothetical protein